MVYGQFEGYRDEDGRGRPTDLETFVAVRAHVDTYRWRGVPFVLRTGKAMAPRRGRDGHAAASPCYEGILPTTRRPPRQDRIDITDDPPITDVARQGPGPSSS